MTGTVGALPVSGAPASDELQVNLLTLSKSFDGPSAPGGTAVLTFDLVNLDPVNPAAGLAFSDNLDNVIPGLVAVPPPSPNPPCGAGSAAMGTAVLSLTSGNLPAGGSCSFDVTVAVPGTATAGSFLNTTSALSQSGLPAAPPATALLTIVVVPPTFDKSFAPASIGAGATSTLTFTIDNSASTAAAIALDFTDNLPAGVVVATPPNAATTCAGGTITATAGSGVIAYTGGTVAAGSSCTVTADVTSPATGSYVNTSGDLTSSLGSSGTATATLTVIAQMCFTGPTATGSGDATFCFLETAAGCGLTDVAYIPLEGGAGSPPAGSAPQGYGFPHGLVTFTIGPSCTPGFTATLTWELPSVLPPGTVYWKYGPTAADPTPHWYPYPAAIAGNLVTFSVTDGGDGDNDLAANGTIVDPSGPGVPTQSILEIPTLAPGSLALLAGLLALGALALLRRRSS